MKTLEDGGLKAPSFDVTDLYYSRPWAHLLKCVKTSIDEFGVVKFCTEVGISGNDFLALVEFCLMSTFIESNNDTFL